MFGNEELDVCKEFEASQKLLYVGSQLFCKFAKDANDLSLLLSLQFSDVIVGFHYFCRLDEDCFACSAFIVNDAFNASFQSRNNRNHQSSISHGWRYIFLNKPFCLS